MKNRKFLSIILFLVLSGTILLMRYNYLMENEETLVFFKSKKSGRWWLQINCSDESKQKYSRHYLIPCTYEDYQEAMKNKIPDRFILAHNKLNL